MVNFRFHLVSVIAVFLALGLGVVMGSTVVDQAIVDRLDREIDDVRAESAARRAENQRLDEELRRTQEFVADSSGFVVEGRLAGVPVVVLAEEGVDGDVVNEAVAMLRTAGAEVPGVFRLDESWTLVDDGAVTALGEVVDAGGAAATVRAAGIEALVDRLGGRQRGPARPTTTTSTAAGAAPTSVPADAEPDVLGALADAGFLGIDGADADDLAVFPPRPARVVVVTGTTSRLVESGITAEVARAFAEADVPTAVTEVFVARDEDGALARGDAVAPVRDDDDLRDAVTTADHLDLVQGRVATVLALEDLPGVVGHYGYGDGAQRALPAPAP